MCVCGEGGGGGGGRGMVGEGAKKQILTATGIRLIYYVVCKGAFINNTQHKHILFARSHAKGTLI